MNTAIATVLAIGFWVIAAMGLVTLMAFVYCEMQYYRWNKQERETEKMGETVEKAVNESLRDIVGKIAGKASEIADDENSENNC